MSQRPGSYHRRGSGPAAPLSRRQFVQFMGGTAVGLLATACAPGASPRPAAAPGPVGTPAALLPDSELKARFAGKTLRVGTYPGVFMENGHNGWGKPFEEATGAKIDYIQGQPMDHVTKILAEGAGRTPPMDVFHSEDQGTIVGVEKGILDPVQADRVPNMSGLFPASAAAFDGYGPVHTYFLNGITYHARSFEQNGIPPIKEWADLWNPKLAGRVALPDVGITSFVATTLIAAAYLAGGSEQNLEPAYPKVRALDAAYYYSSSPDLERAFTSGEVWAAVWIQARTYILASKGVPVEFVAPELPGTGKRGVAATVPLSLVKGSPNRDLAEVYVNYVFSRDPQVHFARTNYYGPTNTEAATIMAADPAYAGKFIASPEEFQRLYIPDWADWGKRQSQVSDRYTRDVKQAR